MANISKFCFFVYLYESNQLCYTTYMKRKIRPLPVKSLSTRCEPRQFSFNSTANLPFDEDIVGQERAIEAIDFGLEMEHKGYNIYVMGPPGMGKHELAKKLVIRKSRLRDTAKDWCYVYNFDNPLKPKVLQLDPGLGQQLKQDMDELIEKLHSDFSESFVHNTMNQLKQRYKKFPKVVHHLDQCLRNIIRNAEDFFRKPKEELVLFDQPHLEVPPFSRLKINVLVDHTHTIGSPVIFEDNPIYHNLIGRVENISITGSLVSDFTLIRPGALHRANHGYLILDAYEVLTHHLAWEGVKRALHTKQVRIEPLERSKEFWSAQTLDPEPIPLDLKVVLVGDRETYYSMCEEEPDFWGLFKVIADFENEIPRNKKNNLRYAKLMGEIARQDKLKPLDKKAVSRVIEYSSRLVEDAEKLSTHVESIKSIIQQADFWAKKENKKTIQREHVILAIKGHRKRLNREQLKVYEDILRNSTLIDTTGTKIGHVNALTIAEVGNYEFGQPCRVTVQVHLGDGELVDIQREVDMSGPIFSKGVLIFSGFLKGRFSNSSKFAIAASIAFEQLYSPIEGDSASAAELCALLSAISEVPVKQSIAVTGSVNQFGEIQSISSANEKIEGFFEICKARKFTGDQGVIIPASNVKNLMLNEEVIAAVRKGLFNVYAAEHIDDIMTILSDLPAGKRTKTGKFAKGSFNHKIELALLRYAKKGKS